MTYITVDYELLFLESRIKWYKTCIEQLHYYRVFELPYLINRVEVQIQNQDQVSDLRTKEGDDETSHPTEEIL